MHTVGRRVRRRSTERVPRRPPEMATGICVVVVNVVLLDTAILHHAGAATGLPSTHNRQQLRKAADPAGRPEEGEGDHPAAGSNRHARGRRRLPPHFPEAPYQRAKGTAAVDGVGLLGLLSPPPGKKNVP